MDRFHGKLSDLSQILLSVVQVADAGHFIQEDAPELVIPAIQTFLGMLK